MRALSVCLGVALVVQSAVAVAQPADGDNEGSGAPAPAPETKPEPAPAPANTGTIEGTVEAPDLDAPLAGAEDALVGTMEHSVLGTRWTYDALADSVYQAELLRTIVEGDTGAGVPANAAATTPVHGSGADGVELAPGERHGDDLIAYGPLTIHVARHPDEAEPIGALGVLTAELTLDGEDVALVLAELRSA